MTGEQFHDALTLLPEDMIARADEVRSRKPKTLHWRRYVSLAACCALLVLCGVLYQNQPAKTASNEMTKTFSAADSAPEMAQAPASGDLGAMDAEIAVHPDGREDTTNYAALIPTQKGEIFPGNVAVVYMTDTIS